MEMRATRAAGWCLLPALGLVLVLLGCGKDKPKTKDNDVDPIDPKEENKEKEFKGPFLFEDVSKDAGIKHEFLNGEEAGHLSIVESLGGGIGLIDYDRDGLLDVFVSGGGVFEKNAPKPEVAGKDIRPYFHDGKVFGRPCKLYRNLGNFRFQNVSEQVLQLKGDWPFNHGFTVGDYDNDGWPDVLVTGYTRVILFHNEPDAKDPKQRQLVDVTESAGLSGVPWSSSAAWADLDGDGLTDLFILCYVDWSFKNHPPSNYDGKTADVCPPKMFKGIPDRVFRNVGKGKFEDVSKQAGIAQGGIECDKGLGLIIADLNLDGKPDIYVANDTVDNFLYFNQSKPGKIALLERAVSSGTAKDDRGLPNGSMGVDVGDPDRRGLPSLFVTNFEGEKHAFYYNEWNDTATPDTHLFTHRSNQARITAIGNVYVAWGTGFVDVMNRGWEDLIIINGHVIRYPTSPGQARFQRSNILRNEGDGTFENISEQGGSFFKEQHMGRGVALGDLDNDGWCDMIVSRIGAPPAVLKNIAPRGNHWLGVQLMGKDRRDVTGARVSVKNADATQWRFEKQGGSYASARDPRHLFGLGKQAGAATVTVYWPDGSKQEYEDLKTDCYYRIVHGAAKPEPVTQP